MTIATIGFKTENGIQAVNVSKQNAELNIKLQEKTMNKEMKIILNGTMQQVMSQLKKIVEENGDAATVADVCLQRGTK